MHLLLDLIRRSVHLLLDWFALMATSRTPCRICFLLVIQLLVVVLFVMMLRMLSPGVLVEVLLITMLVLVFLRGRLEVLFVAMLFMLLPGGLAQSQPFLHAMMFPRFLEAHSHHHGGPLR